MAQKKTVLIIEDEYPILEALRLKLEDEGYELFTAPDGSAGLDIALREKPDLILLDIIMPKVDGISMLRKLREDEWGKRAKVLILTNLTDNEKIAQAAELDAGEYLVKTDWKINDIAAKIKQKLSE